MASAGVVPQSPSRAEWRHRAKSRSPPQALTTSHVTVADHAGSPHEVEGEQSEGDRDALPSPLGSPRPAGAAASGPGAGNASLAGLGRASRTERCRPTAFSSDSPEQSSRNEERKTGPGMEAAAVLVVASERSESNPVVDIKAGAVVRWVHGAYAAHVAFGQNGEAFCGLADGSGDGKAESDGNENSGIAIRSGGNGGRGPLTVTVSSAVLDEPMTRELPHGGSFAEMVLDQPGYYRYHICSGPVTTGSIAVNDESSTVTKADPLSPPHTSDSPAPANDIAAALSSGRADSDLVHVRKETETIQILGEEGSVEGEVSERLPVVQKEEDDVFLKDIIVERNGQQDSVTGKETLEIDQVDDVVPETQDESSPLPTTPKDPPVPTERGTSHHALEEMTLRTAAVQINGCDENERAESGQFLLRCEGLQGQRSPFLDGSMTPMVSSLNDDSDEGRPPQRVTPLPSQVMTKLHSSPGRRKKKKRPGRTVSDVAMQNREDRGSGEEITCDESSFASTSSGRSLYQQDYGSGGSGASFIREDVKGTAAAVTVASAVQFRGSDEALGSCTAQGFVLSAVCVHDNSRQGPESGSAVRIDRPSPGNSPNCSSSFDDDEGEDENIENKKIVHTREIAVWDRKQAKRSLPFDAKEAAAVEHNDSKPTQIDSPSAPSGVDCAGSDTTPSDEPSVGLSTAVAEASGDDTSERAKLGQLDEDEAPPSTGANVGGDPVSPLSLLQGITDVENGKDEPPRTDTAVAGIKDVSAIATLLSTLSPVPRPDYAGAYRPRNGGDSSGGFTGGSQPSSFDSDDVPSGGWRIGGDGGGGEVDTTGTTASTWEALRIRASSPTRPMTLNIVGVVAEDKMSPCRSETSPLPTLTEFSPERPRKQRVEILQRDESGQEWQEVSPLSSPAARGSTANDLRAFPCDGDDHDVSLSPGTIEELAPSIARVVFGGMHEKPERRPAQEKEAAATSSVNATEEREAPLPDDEESEERMHTAVGTLSHPGKGNALKSPTTYFLSSMPSAVAATAASAAGMATASATRAPQASSVVFHGETARGNGGRASASTTEKDPRCRAWSDNDVDESSESYVSTERDSHLSRYTPIADSASSTASSEPRKCLDGVDSHERMRVMSTEDGEAGQAMSDPNVFTAPIGTRARWDLRGGKKCAAAAAIAARPETFERRVSVGGDGKGHNEDQSKVAFSFSLSPAQPASEYTCPREGRYKISSDGPEKLGAGTAGRDRRGEVVIEQVAGISDSDSFESDKHDGDLSDSFASFDDNDDDGHVDGYGVESNDSDSIAPPSPPSSPRPPPQQEERKGSAADDDRAVSSGQFSGGENDLASVAKRVGTSSVVHSSGVSTQDSVVHAPTAPPSVTILSVKTGSPSVNCVDNDLLRRLLRRHRSLPPISALLKCRGFGHDSGGNGNGKYLFGRSGSLLLPDRHNAVDCRNQANGCCTVTTETAEYWSVAGGDGIILPQVGASCSTRSSSYDAGVFCVSTLSKGSKHDGKRADDPDDDDSNDSDDAVVVDLNDIVFDTADGSGDSSDGCRNNRIHIGKEHKPVSASLVASFLSTRPRRVEAGVQSGQEATDEVSFTADRFGIKPALPHRRKYNANDGGELLENNAAMIRVAPIVVAAGTAIHSDGEEGGAAMVTSVRHGDTDLKQEELGLDASASGGARKKKKKKSKKKKLSGEGENAVNLGGTVSGAGGVGVFDVGGQQQCRDAPAFLQEAGLYLQSRMHEQIDRTLGGGAKTGRVGAVGDNPAAMAKAVKTIIAWDQGFKPAKPFTVQVEAVVSIKKTTLPQSACIYQPRAISLVGPMDTLPAPSLFHEGSNKVDDLPPRGSRSVEFGHGVDDIEAVFRKPGEYFLVDHFASKRIKITATLRLLQPPPPTVSASSFADAALPSSLTRGGVDGQDGGSSLAGKDGIALVAECVADRQGLVQSGRQTSTFSRSKEKKGKGKGKGKDKTGAAATRLAENKVVQGAAPAPADAADALVDLSTDPTDTKSNVDADGSDHEGRGIQEEREEEHRSTITAYTSPAEGEAESSVHEVMEQRSTSVPAMAASGNSHVLSSGERKGFEVAGALGEVKVSYKRGFEPEVLEIGFAPGRGALVVCELDRQERMTREVICLRDVAGPLNEMQGAKGAAGIAENATRTGGKDNKDRATAATKAQAHRCLPRVRGKVAAAAGKMAAELMKGGEVVKHPHEIVSARLGPGGLRVCHFLLGQAGKYRLACRDDTEKGAALVVRSSDIMVIPPSEQRAGLPESVDLTPMGPAATSIAATLSDGAGKERMVPRVLPAQNRDDKPQDKEADCRASSSGIGSSDSEARHGSRSSHQMAGCRKEKWESCPEEAFVDKNGTRTKSAVSFNARSPAIQPLQDFDGVKQKSAVARWGDQTAIGERRVGDGDKDANFVQQRSHLKRSRRQQRSKAKENDRAEVAKAAAEAMAVQKAAEKSEESEAAAAIVTVNALIAAEHDAAVAATAKASKNAMVNESSKADGATRPENLRKTEEWITDGGTSSTESALASSATVAPAMEAASPSGCAAAEQTTMSENVEAERITTSVTATSTSKRVKVLNSPKTVTTLPMKRLVSPDNFADVTAATTINTDIERRDGPTHTGKNRQPWNSACLDAGGEKLAHSSPATDAAAVRVSRWTAPSAGASRREDDSYAPVAVRPDPTLDVPRQRDSAGPGAAAGGSTLPLCPRVARKGKPTLALRGPTGLGVPPSKQFPRPNVQPLTSLPTVPLRSSPVRLGWGGVTTQNGGRGVVGRDRLTTVSACDCPSSASAAAGVTEGTYLNDQGNNRNQHTGQEKATSGCVSLRRVGDEGPISSTRKVDDIALDAVLAAATSVVTGSNSDDLPRPISHPAAGSRPSLTSCETKGHRKSNGYDGATRKSERRDGQTQASPLPLPSPSCPSTTTTKEGRDDRDAGLVSAQNFDSCCSDHSEQPAISFGDFEACPVDVKQIAAIAGPPRVASFSAVSSCLLEGSSTQSGANAAATEFEEVKTPEGCSGEVPSSILAGQRHDDGDVELRVATVESQPNDFCGDDECGKSFIGWGHPSEEARAPARREAEGGWGNSSWKDRRRLWGDDTTRRGEHHQTAVGPLTTAITAPSSPAPTMRQEESAPLTSSTPLPPDVVPSSARSTSSNEHDSCTVQSATTTTTPDALRWGNCSTTVSREERARRSRELLCALGTRPSAPSLSGGGGCPRPAEFPDGSRLPSGGYWVPETVGDCLPPASEFEKVEAARMMRLYHAMMKRLRDGGTDEKLPNGHVPVIYDLTDGGSS